MNFSYKKWTHICLYFFFIVCFLGDVGFSNVLNKTNILRNNEILSPQPGRKKKKKIATIPTKHAFSTTILLNVKRGKQVNIFSHISEDQSVDLDANTSKMDGLLMEILALVLLMFQSERQITSRSQEKG